MHPMLIESVNLTIKDIGIKFCKYARYSELTMAKFALRFSNTIINHRYISNL